MHHEEIIRHSALDLATLIADGDLSAREVVDAHLARIDAVDPVLNAVVVRRDAQARAEADAVDARRQRGEPLPPLAGVPLSVKEAIDMAGMPSTGGLPSRSAHRATQDDPALARLRHAGAIVIGKTNAAQALIFAETDNPLHGRCSNPWNTGRSCGGSSGGEGAILAAGGAALGLGTDIGGSVRIPAASCGITGIKPTAGRLPDRQRLSVPIGEEAIASQLGLLARRVDDVATALAIVNDPSFVLRDLADVDLSGLRIGVYEDDGLFAPAPAARRAVGLAAAALGQFGATVVPWRIPHPALVNSLFYRLVTADGMAGLRRLLVGDKKDARVAQLMFLGGSSRPTRAVLAALARALGQHHLAALLPHFGGVSVDAYWRACEARRDYIEVFGRAMDEAEGGPLDALLGPTTALPAFTHGSTKYLGVPGVYTTVCNLTGYPAGTVPVTRVASGEESRRPDSADRAEKAARTVEAGSAGLPIGVQVIARPWREDIALAAMRAIEVARSGAADFPATPCAMPGT